MKKILVLLFSLLILIAFTEYNEVFRFSGKIIDYSTGEGVEDIIVNFEVMNTGENYCCRTDENGNYFIDIEITTEEIDKEVIIVTPEGNYKDMKFSPGRVIITNDEDYIEKMPLISYKLDEVLDESKEVVIKFYEGRCSGVTYLGNGRWQFIYDHSDFYPKEDREEIESVSFGHELGRLDVKKNFMRQDNGIWINEIDLSGENPNSESNKDKKYYSDQFEFSLILERKGKTEESNIYIVEDTHLLEKEAVIQVENHNNFNLAAVLNENYPDDNLQHILKEENTAFRVVEYPCIDKIVEFLDRGRVITAVINPRCISKKYKSKEFNLKRKNLDEDHCSNLCAVVIKGYNKYEIEDKEFILFKVDGVENKYEDRGEFYTAEDILRGIREMNGEILVITDEKIEVKPCKITEGFKLNYEQLYIDF